MTTRLNAAGQKIEVLFSKSYFENGRMKSLSVMNCSSFEECDELALKEFVRLAKYSKLSILKDNTSHIRNAERKHECPSVMDALIEAALEKERKGQP